MRDDAPVRRTRSASQILHVLIGTPRVEECADVDSPCWVCGSWASRGMDRLAWMGASFVGQNRVRAPHASVICEACVYVMARSSPVPGRPAKDGKSPPNWRNFSVLVEGDQLTTATKAEKPAILAFLRRPHVHPWFAAIADSGQKHVVPYAPVNPPGSSGVVMFEEDVVRIPPQPDGQWQLISDISELLTAGATKAEVERGEYESWTWQRCGEHVRAFEERWSAYRNSKWMKLCLWLAQRDEEAVARRLEEEKRARLERAAEERSARRGRTGRACGEIRVSRQRGVDPHALGSDPGSDASSSTDDGVRGGVVHRSGQEPSARDACQGEFV